nr:immunoglobulin heavy chain junction region [Mus musculus]
CARSLYYYGDSYFDYW